MDTWEILTEYEVGRAMSLIEWVGRGDKPIAELVSRSATDPGGIVRDLGKCIAESHQSVKGYILETEPTVWSCGFYSKPWAIEAFAALYCDGENFCLEKHRHWIAGLLFGYTPSSISDFIAELDGPEATSQPLDTGRKVEMFPLATRQSRNCSDTSASATSPTSGNFGQFVQSLDNPFNPEDLKPLPLTGTAR